MIIANKRLGETPLQLIKRLRSEGNGLENLTLGYAGRLDPMAEGLMLLLVNDENLDRKRYERLDKVYELKILLGVATDTFDLMGLVVASINENISKEHVALAKDALTRMTGDIEQFYPPYSAIEIKGHPLWWWAKNNRLNEVNVPKKTIHIKKVELLGFGETTNNDLLSYVKETVSIVDGSFRQDEIINKWEDTLLANESISFPLISIQVLASSGTYMRSIANEVGRLIGVPSVAYSIKRVSVGEHKLEDLGGFSYKKV